MTNVCAIPAILLCTIKALYIEVIKIIVFAFRFLERLFHSFIWQEYVDNFLCDKPKDISNRQSHRPMGQVKEIHTYRAHFNTTVCAYAGNEYSVVQLQKGCINYGFCCCYYRGFLRPS